MSDADVIIVGAGPVGVLNALGLAQRGVRVLLMERFDDVVESPRACVYHWSVLEGLDTLGVLDDAIRLGFKKQDYQYYIYSTGERISWSMAPLAEVERFPFNVHLGQNVLAKIVLEKLKSFDNVRVVWNTTYVGVDQDENGVTVHAEGPDGPVDYTASWLLGADGAGSRVRSSVGLEFEGMTWPERFVATNVRFDFQSRGYAQATMQVDPVYGAIVAKIDETGLWRVTYMEDASLPEETVAERIPAFYERIMGPGAEYELEGFSPYKMHQRSAETYRVGRVLLAGDAAHATNPTGGLGLTGGLFDTYVLYPALSAVVKGEAGEEVLDRYAEERRRVFWDVVSPAASENKRFVYGSTDPERLERDLEGVRAMVKDPELLWQRLRFPDKLRTPDLVS